MVAGLGPRDLARAIHAELGGLGLLALMVPDTPPAEVIAERAILALIDGFTEPIP
jgi:hypothetical protein